MRLTAMVLCMAGAGLAPALLPAQATGSVDVAVTILPAPTFVDMTPRTAAQPSALRVVGAASCSAQLEAAGVSRTLGACGAAGTLSPVVWAELRRVATSGPVRLTLTLDAGT